ncbi:pentatricopeptide repeat-containing protein At4g02750-like [Selaginella moellendorffii]|uniref:pentatricopeptide repeat-containing protein At4g02750-like n=1 Tax=Selaginella moellendorffii TaxID=88036 RepID=UPI000D1CFF9A|nr:pentatricopeptide repeat-containing protein At4g02750-like [Selaginella moellendorffii]|eukprot:XP_024523624.1 pentatricopeptide repeat-containing protein At4g02750-like [Selaginella moellendorffii]
MECNPVSPRTSWDLKYAERIISGVPEYDLVSWNSILTAYARKGHEREKRVFDSMEARDLVSWTTILVALSQGGDLHGAKLLFDAMPQHDLVAWTAMLGAYALNEDVDSTQRIFREMPEIDLVSCNTVMPCCVMLDNQSLYLTPCRRELSHLEPVKATFDQMPQRDLCSWNSVLSVYAQSGHCDFALSLFNEMPEMDMVSWNNMLNAFVLTRKLREAALLFHSMLERNVVTWDALISAFSREGHIVYARKLFDTAPDRDQILWSSMIASYAQVSTTASKAFHLFNEMQAVDSPNTSCFASILAANSHKGSFQAGKSFFASMVVDHAIEPTRQHYSCMVDLLSRAGHLHDAKDLILSMPFVPSALEWTCLLGACKSHEDYNNLRLGDDVVRSVMDVTDATPKTPYALLANVYTSSQTKNPHYM